MGRSVQALRTLYKLSLTVYALSRGTVPGLSITNCFSFSSHEVLHVESHYHLFMLKEVHRTRRPQQHTSKALQVVPSNISEACKAFRKLRSFQQLIVSRVYLRPQSSRAEASCSASCLGPSWRNLHSEPLPLVGSPVFSSGHQMVAPSDRPRIAARSAFLGSLSYP